MRGRISLGAEPASAEITQVRYGYVRASNFCSLARLVGEIRKSGTVHEVAHHADELAQRRNLGREQVAPLTLDEDILRPPDKDKFLQDSRESLVTWLAPLCRALGHEAETPEHVLGVIQRHCGLGFSAFSCRQLRLGIVEARNR